MPKNKLIQDRQVHARVGSVEIVRYDRAGKWWVEGPHKRRPVSVREATEIAREGEVFFGVYGGSTFDRIVRRLA